MWMSDYSFSDLKNAIAAAEDELSALDARRTVLLEKIRSLRDQQIRIGLENVGGKLDSKEAGLTNLSTQDEKIALFRNLFRGREDVYPRRFESIKTGKKGYLPVCQNEWVTGVCLKPKIRCEQCNHRMFAPVTDDVVRNHLTGFDPKEHSGKDFVIGVYPLLPDDTCWFLAVDFDKTTWQQDAGAFFETCRSYQVPAAFERSRSGNGAHLWIFFSEIIPATVARKLGTFLLTQTMERRPEIGLDSYDRFFPNQDTLPKGGFGNLIALPLQKKARDNGNTLFLDDQFIPYTDQWAFLSSVRRMSRKEVESLVAQAEQNDRILPIRVPVTDEADDEPWTAPPSRHRKEMPIIGPLPEQIQLVLGNQVYVPKEFLSPSLHNRLIRLAAFQNPEFFQAQGMRLSTFGKPRIISCAEDFPKHIGLPRGCLDEVTELFETLKVKVEIADERNKGETVDVQFDGMLRPEQQSAVEALLKHDLGVLSASTAFGKTVIACFLIAQRKTNTLVIVHRRQLLDQWIETLSHFLHLDKKEIGQIGGGKNRPTGKIDVAMIQSLSDKGVVNDLVGNYGYLIVDECHHISAVSFEQVVRQSKARYVTGLSATVARKDGHHPIIFMQCGPVRYHVSDRSQAEARPFEHHVIIRPTSFALSEHLEGLTIQQNISELYALLVTNDNRNQMIVADVIRAVRDKRSPVVLTERREHLEMLEKMLSPLVKNVIVMTGGMGKKQRVKLAEKIASIPIDEERVILATGRYLGEGFDDSRLDTLFLTLPIAWRGTLTQYAGRLHRENSTKREVIIYDYVDFHVPVLAKMYAKRRSGYKSIGYEVKMPDDISKPIQLKLETKP
jgi:superfamily II DNA or RNA helicase